MPSRAFLLLALDGGGIRGLGGFRREEARSHDALR